MRVLLPGAEVLDETPGIVGALAIFARGLKCARFKSIPARSSAISPGSNSCAGKYGSVALKLLDDRFRSSVTLKRIQYLLEQRLTPVGEAGVDLDAGRRPPQRRRPDRRRSRYRPRR
jgi:hypothetical protein